MRAVHLASSLLAAFLAAALAGGVPARAVESCLGKARLRSDVFEEGAARMKPDADALLDLLARAINDSCKGKSIEIQGHVQATGEPGRDQQLSQARADEVKRALVARGVAAERLRAVGYGGAHPQSSDPKDADLNTRISLVVEGE